MCPTCLGTSLLVMENTYWILCLTLRDWSIFDIFLLHCGKCFLEWYIIRLGNTAELIKDQLSLTILGRIRRHTAVQYIVVFIIVGSSTGSLSTRVGFAYGIWVVIASAIHAIIVNALVAIVWKVIQNSDKFTRMNMRLPRNYYGV